VDSESDEQLNLAFIQLFRTVEPADHWTGMFKVKTLEKDEVVEVDSIERGVHLIPCFLCRHWITTMSFGSTIIQTLICTTRFMCSLVVVTKECKHNEHPSDIEHFLSSLRFFRAHWAFFELIEHKS